MSVICAEGKYKDMNLVISCVFFAPDYDHLPLIAKVEVFESALHNTEGNDLSRV